MEDLKIASQNDYSQMQTGRLTKRLINIVVKACLINSPCFIFRIRMAGIKGLQGVVRKTVNDELQANIWDPQHMDKIVPSLLFNLQSGERTER